MKRILVLCMLGSLLLTDCQLSKEESFEIAARKLTKQCPVAIDANIYLDSLVYNKQDSLFQYYYSLTEASDKEFADWVANPLFAKSIRENVINSTEMKPYKEYGMTFVYRYYSKRSRKLLGTIKITPADYN